MHWKVLGSEPVVTDGQASVVLGHPLIGPIPASAVLAEYTPPSRSVAALMSPLLGSALEAALPDGWCGTPGCRGTAK